MASDARHRLGLRLLAVGSLLLVSLALAGILRGGDATTAATASAGGVDLSELRLRSAAVVRELKRLHPDRSGRDAREAIKKAMRERDRLASSAAGERLANALDAHAEYLDALGSTIANPSSPLRRRLPARARRLVAAFRSLPDPSGLPSTVTGWRRAMAFAETRRARRNR